MQESVPRRNVNRSPLWWFKFAFACLAAGFGGWLLVAVLGMPLFGYKLFDDPYRSLIDGALVVACAPLIWRWLR
jgi:hypothetical protein